MGLASRSSVVPLSLVVATSACVFKDFSAEGSDFSTEGPAYSVSGRVVGPPGGPPGLAATVSLSAPGMKDKQTKSDASGSYTFSGVPVGTYLITPALAGYLFQPATLVAKVSQADVHGIDFLARPTLEVYGRDMGGYYQNVSILAASVRVNDAEVKVNGQPLSHPAGWYEDGFYNDHLATLVPTGGELHLEVSRGGARVTATGAVPEPPLLTSPGEGASYTSNQDIRVSWTSTSQPDRFTINAQWSCGAQCGTGKTFNVPGSVRSFTIAGAAIPSGQIDISVFAYNDGRFSGDYEPFATYPGMNIRAESSRVTISH